MIIPAGYAQVTHFFSGAALPTGAAITWGALQATVDSPAGLAIDAYNFFEARVLGELSDAVQTIGTLVKFGPNSTGPLAFYGEIDSGGSVGNDVPPNTAILVRKQTAFGGRSNRGRFYVPGLLTTGVGDGGTLVAGKLGALQTAFTNFFGDINASGREMVILHNNSSDPTIVGALEVQPKAATIRRRLRR